MDKEFWDTRYAEEGFAYGTDVNRYLASCSESGVDSHHTFGAQGRRE